MGMSQCDKVAYATHDLALKAIYYYQSRAKQRDDVPIRVYYCHKCERFHITSQPKKAFNTNQQKDFLWFLNQLMSTEE